MQMVKYSLVFVVIFYLSLVLLAPKKELYYKVEQELYKKGLIIDGEDIKETPLGVELMHPTIIYNGIKVATAKEIKIITLFLYTKTTINDIKDRAGLKNFFPLMPKSMLITHKIWNPYRLDIEMFGKFGKAVGFYDIKEHLFHINLSDDKNIAPIRRYLKKGDNGWYYEERF